MNTIYETQRSTVVTMKRGPGRPPKPRPAEISLADAPSEPERHPRFEIIDPPGDWVLVDACVPRELAEQMQALFRGHRF